MHSLLFSLAITGGEIYELKSCRMYFLGSGVQSARGFSSCTWGG